MAHPISSALIEHAIGRDIYKRFESTPCAYCAPSVHDDLHEFPGNKWFATEEVQKESVSPTFHQTSSHPVDCLHRQSRIHVYFCRSWTTEVAVNTIDVAATSGDDGQEGWV